MTTSTKPTYKIIRNFFNKPDEIIKRGLTFIEARAHCRDRETSSSTCSNATLAEVGEGPWFDSYYEE